MRIAYLTGSFPRPSETFIVNQIAGVIEAGHDVDIYASARASRGPYDPTIERLDLMRRMRQIEIPQRHFRRAATALGYIIRHGLWRRPDVLRRVLDFRSHGHHARNLSLLYTAMSFLNNPGYDLVHCQFGEIGARAVALKQTRVITGQLVVSFRGADLSRTLKRHPSAYDNLFSQGDLFLPVSHAFKERLIASGCPERKIRVLHSGIDVERFAMRPRVLEQGQQVHLLSIGRLTPKKGFEFAIEAVAKLVKAGYPLKYTILGDGALKRELERRVAAHAVEPQIELAGWKHPGQVATYLNAAHVFLAPSITADDGDAEGIPNVLKEAMATAMPVVSTVHSGIPELVEDGVSGLLAPERDVDALSSCIARLVDRPDRWQDMGTAGRRRIEERFDIRALNRKLIELYEQLLVV